MNEYSAGLLLTTRSDETRPRHTSSDSQKNCSRKLKDNSDYYKNHFETMEYDIVDLHQLFENLNQVVFCKICQQSRSFERQPVVSYA